MPKIKINKDLPDIQQNGIGFPPKHIKKVGIRGVKVPLKILRKDGSINIASGDISIYTDLNKMVKGSNMSRYRILIEEFLIGKDIQLHELIREMLPVTQKRLDALNSYIKVKFDYFLTKVAPASGLKCHMDYKGCLEGRLLTKLDGTKEERYYLTVTVPYTSCCVCSKHISNYGAHNQRSSAEVKMELINGQMVWIEDIIDIVENCASSPIINILKRNDEAYQTELMYENAKFVEDVVRDVATKLDKLLDTQIKDYVVVAEHFESIHTHNCIGIVTAGRDLQ
jgi:GTP cyclohydrolase IB